MPAERDLDRALQRLKIPLSGSALLAAADTLHRSDTGAARLKRRARDLATRCPGLRHTQALDCVALLDGYADWFDAYRTLRRTDERRDAAPIRRRVD